MDVLNQVQPKSQRLERMIFLIQLKLKVQKINSSLEKYVTINLPEAMLISIRLLPFFIQYSVSLARFSLSLLLCLIEEKGSGGRSGGGPEEVRSSVPI